MPASAIDSLIFRNIFGSAEMRGVWSDEFRTQKYLDRKAALARAQASLGIISKEAATEITRVCKVENIDSKRYPEETLTIGYPVLGSVRQGVAALLDAMVEDHERATGPWQIEWITLPDVFTLAGGALSQACFVLEGLEVHADQMRANLDITRGLIVSEAVMMGLALRLGRDKAHDVLYAICHDPHGRDGGSVRGRDPRTDQSGKLPWPVRGHGGSRVAARRLSIATVDRPTGSP